jgi:hypothetical protein
MLQFNNKNLTNIVSKMILMNNSIDDHINRRLCKIFQAHNYDPSCSNQLFRQKNKLKKQKIGKKSDICASDSAGSGR